MQWLVDVFLHYLDEWEQEIGRIPGLEKKEQRKMCLSLETLEGLRISGIYNDTSNFKGWVVNLTAFLFFFFYSEVFY